MLLKNITRLCKERGISIAKLERETGIGNGTIGRWGISSPSVENVRKVADFFGVTVDALISGRTEMPTE
jgi:transcriptional regulator with XRE-family HTH domain